VFSCYFLVFPQNLLSKMLEQIAEHYDGLNTRTVLSRGGFTKSDINVAVIHQVCLLFLNMFAFYVFV